LKGKPELVRVHDFNDKQLGKAIPYGVYDLRLDEGYVNVGIDHDTAQFAASSIRSWWEYLGRERYPHATRLQITADCGGSNSNGSFAHCHSRLTQAFRVLSFASAP
jgi:Rhodopirellula transposase DDE domain